MVSHVRWLIKSHCNFLVCLTLDSVLLYCYNLEVMGFLFEIFSIHLLLKNEVRLIVTIQYTQGPFHRHVTWEVV